MLGHNVTKKKDLLIDKKQTTFYSFIINSDIGNSDTGKVKLILHKKKQQR